MKDLTKLSLGELRELYPTIKATSRVVFLKLVAEQEAAKSIEVVDEVIVDEVIVDEVIVDEKEDEKEDEKDDEDLKEYIESEFSESEIKEDLFLEFIASRIMTRKKILIKCEDSTSADDLFLRCQYGLFPKLNDKGISVLASANRRDMSLNGTCYVRIACAKNFDHLKQLMVYTDFNEVIK